MKNKVGQPVRDKNFFKRPSIIRKIYRRLDNRSNIYLAAPRRVGKTSIMYYLEDNPKKGYDFIYINTESVNETEDYFKRLFEGLLNSDSTQKLIKASKKAKKIFSETFERVKKIGGWGVSIEFNQKGEGKYSDEFFRLMKKLTSDEFTIVLMIDEFPATIENIAKNQSPKEAIHFLQLNRTIRQESGDGLLMMYTGSIGLAPVVNRLELPEGINDLNTIEIPPLSQKEGYDLTQKLLISEEIPYDPRAIDFLLEKIEWLMPFFIQLSVQEIIDGYDTNPNKVDKKAVEEALVRIYNRRNNIHFDSYYDRLKGAFSKEEYDIALQILDLVATQPTMPASALFVGTNKKNEKLIKAILGTLEYDGYISRTNGSYRFNSPILREWWNRNPH